MNKNRAWGHVSDYVGGDAAVRTSNPEELGRLSFGKFCKKLGIDGTLLCHPLFVFFQQSLMRMKPRGIRWRTAITPCTRK